MNVISTEYSHIFMRQLSFVLKGDDVYLVYLGISEAFNGVQC